MKYANFISPLLLTLISCHSALHGPGGPGRPKPMRLGWVDHDSSAWSEVDELNAAQYVVHMGLNSQGCSHGKCQYAAQHITKIEDGGLTLCPIELAQAGEAILGQYSLGGGFTGVIVETEPAPVVVTAKHADAYVSQDVLRNHHAMNEDAKICGDSWIVPASDVLQIDLSSRFDSDKYDVMIFDLVGYDGTGVHLANSPDGSVYTLSHPLGLPLKKANANEAACQGTSCYVDVDFASGASGGAVFTEEGELAGILLGSQNAATIGSKHGHRDKLHPCRRRSTGCLPRRADSSEHRHAPLAQEFLPSAVIREVLNEKKKRDTKP